MFKPGPRDGILGMLIAMTIFFSWGGFLLFLLTREISGILIPLMIPAILLQAFLYTGLFITAHDAMHDTIFPRHKIINQWVGGAAVFLFALFSYRRLKKKHWDHHRMPASADDPDFHGKYRHPLLWYLHFMTGYVTWKQIAGMAIVFNLLQFIFLIPAANLILFWVVPSLLSTVQLFWFGTYLPHRETGDGYRDRHHARSNDYSVLWSFLSCYHFGYHWEHHEYPYVPWWRLPQVRRNSTRTGAIDNQLTG